MPTFRVVLVEPKSQGNVGSAARVMKNFGQTELVLVNPPPLGDEAEGRAMHAMDVVQNAKTFATLAEGIRGCDYVVGTSARIPDPEKTYLRVPIDAREFPKRVEGMQGTVALLFGREDFGLFNTELELCDLLVTIPSSDLYRSLNLAHAVGIVLYELYAQREPRPVREVTPMSEQMRRTFQETFDRLIDEMKLPEHKAKNSKTVYRKLFGRAVPSAWEYYSMMGILRRCLERFGVFLPEAPSLPDFDIPPGIDEEIERMLVAESAANDPGGSHR